MGSYWKGLGSISREPHCPTSLLTMWRLFRTGSGARAALFKRTTASNFLRVPKRLVSPKAVKYHVAGTTTLALFLGGVLANDSSNNSLEGVAVDSAIDPFPTKLSTRDYKFLGSDHKLAATGVRSVTFIGFKVYGVGLYISEKSEKQLLSIVSRFVSENPGLSAQDVFNDKDISQRLVTEVAKHVPYAVKITPVRNTDFGHMRDGLTKSILAAPMAKVLREEVGRGVEQLREVFLASRGSVPKNDTLWVVSDGLGTKIVHQGKNPKVMGTVTEPSMAVVLLVLYLSNAKPLSEPLRQSFVSYIGERV